MRYTSSLRHRLSSYVNMTHVYRATLNSHISMEIISVDHTKFLVKVELTRVQEPGSSPKFS